MQVESPGWQLMKQERNAEHIGFAAHALASDEQGFPALIAQSRQLCPPSAQMPVSMQAGAPELELAILELAALSLVLEVLPPPILAPLLSLPVLALLDIPP